jgi:hypothetical protein
MIWSLLTRVAVTTARCRMLGHPIGRLGWRVIGGAEDFHCAACGESFLRWPTREDTRPPERQENSCPNCQGTGQWWSTTYECYQRCTMCPRPPERQGEE